MEGPRATPPVHHIFGGRALSSPEVSTSASTSTKGNATTSTKANASTSTAKPRRSSFGTVAAAGLVRLRSRSGSGTGESWGLSNGLRGRGNKKQPSNVRGKKQAEEGQRTNISPPPPLLTVTAVGLEPGESGDDKGAASSAGGAGAGGAGAGGGAGGAVVVVVLVVLVVLAVLVVLVVVVLVLVLVLVLMSLGLRLPSMNW
jgi:hypothetical protein